MENYNGATRSARTRIRVSSSCGTIQRSFTTPDLHKEKTYHIALHVLTVAKEKPNVDTKLVKNPRIVDAYFSQRANFEKIQEQIYLTLSSEVLKKRFSEHVEFYDQRSFKM